MMICSQYLNVVELSYLEVKTAFKKGKKKFFTKGPFILSGKIFFFNGKKGGGGYSLTGKTTNLHFVILGSIPNISKKIYHSKFNKIRRLIHLKVKLEKLNLVERNTEDV